MHCARPRHGDVAAGGPLTDREAAAREGVMLVPQGIALVAPLTA